MNQQGSDESETPHGPPFPPSEPVGPGEAAPPADARPLESSPFFLAEDDTIDEEFEDFEDFEDDFAPDDDEPRFETADFDDATRFDEEAEIDWRSAPNDTVPPEKRRLPPDEEPDANPFARRAAREVKRRASGSVQRNFASFADRLDEVAERIDRLASEQLDDGPGERAGDAAHLTAGWITEISEYLRQADIDAVRADLEHQVRAKPLRSILLAAGAGWMVGRILR